MQKYNHLRTKLKIIDRNDDGFVIRTRQEIPQEFLDYNQEQAHYSTQRTCGNFEKVCSIPAVFYWKWKDQGIDIDEMTKEQLVAFLSTQDLSAFITSKKIGNRAARRKANSKPH